jgi:hypothetical protein
VLHFGQGYGYVLGIIPVETPQLATSGWFRDPMAIVVEKDRVFFGLFP